MLGLGTWRMAEGAEAESSVSAALELGYRHIDTAALYGNEAGVGRALAQSGVRRESVFVTTKVWNDDLRKGEAAVRAAFDASLDRLKMDYVDLYLIHWPVPDKFIAAWKVLEQIHASGRARAIGVSNFLVSHLQALLPHATVKPMVNQVEFHPWLMQRPLMELCRRERIILEAWSPLMQAKGLDLPALVEIAKAHQRSPAQVVLRWDIQHQVVTIPKSTHRRRIVENAAIFDFELSPDEMARIDALDQSKRIGPSPDNFDF